MAATQAPPAHRPRLHPGLLLLGTLVASGWLGWAFPAGIPVGSYEGKAAIGAVLVASAVVLWLLSVRILMRRATSPEPGMVPVALVAEGPFRFGRNPMYLAGVLVSAGFGALFDSLWSLGGALVLWLALDVLVVPFEERVLREAFGEAYDEYCGAVPRWLTLISLRRRPARAGR